MNHATILFLLAAAGMVRAADIQSDWIAELSAKVAHPLHARVKLNVAKSSITGTWKQVARTGSQFNVVAKVPKSALKGLQ